MLTPKQTQILDRADEIIGNQNDSYRYETTCAKAGICPKCGADIEEKESVYYGTVRVFNCSSNLCENKNGYEVKGWSFSFLTGGDHD